MVCGITKNCKGTQMKRINIIKDEQTGIFSITNFQEVKSSLEEWRVLIRKF